MSRKAIRRIECCVETLAEFGCAPTFPTPGIIVQRYPKFIRQLQSAGAEIAVHGYQHLDLSLLPPAVAVRQLVRAVRAFEHAGINVYGFRCPYVGCGTELLEALPSGLFEYSSNEAIYWDGLRMERGRAGDGFFNTLNKFYCGQPAADVACVPRKRSNMVEIPACIPDDLQLHDGLGMCPEEIAHLWGEMLAQTYQRGELLTLLSHPELASVCNTPFACLLKEARRLRPTVWIARLRDISSWWREKAAFRVEASQNPAGLRLAFACSPRATILARGLGGQGWDETYSRLLPAPLCIPAGPRPFVGLSRTVPAHISTFLENQGYILDTSVTAPQCGVFLSAATLSRLTTEVEIINFIEQSPRPLIKYGRWPDGAKSALCITGDLDALALVDYASRLFFSLSARERQPDRPEPDVRAIRPRSGQTRPAH
jgi:hypothetical protein